MGAPGSSLGGARPKANVLDEQGNPWIAKFPSKNDAYDVGAWELLLYQLASSAGVVMAESKLLNISGNYHTFLTKRFDRIRDDRIHFASAMTITGNNEDTVSDHTASYLDLAEFIRFSGSNSQTDLHQLWRRIVFNIAVSNTDDHLRNHGFLLSRGGWRLAPAYDMNPTIDKDGLSLNIDMDNNALDFQLAWSVGEYFMLADQEMQNIFKEVSKAVQGWRAVARNIGISRQEQETMATAFRW